MCLRPWSKEEVKKVQALEASSHSHRLKFKRNPSMNLLEQSMTLLSIDRFGDMHEISFSAQDDDWGSSWTGRSGIPLSSFAKRWDELEKRPSTADQTSMLDRSRRLTGGDSSSEIAITLEDF